MSVIKKQNISSYSKIIVRSHYLPFSQKCLKKLFLLIYTITLLPTISLPKISLPKISPGLDLATVTNQLIFLVHQIYSSFDHPENLDVRSVYLDMSKAFDKVWHEGLRQNGVTGKLISLLEQQRTKNSTEWRVIGLGANNLWCSSRICAWSTFIPCLH